MVPDLFQDESSVRSTRFTFSNPKQRRGGSDDAGDGWDGSDYMAWAERIKGDRGGNFGLSHGRSVGAWTRRSTATPPSMSSGGGGSPPRYVRHGWYWSAEQDDGYGTPSPPLWKNSGNYSPRRAGATARAQEIARYRQEMMELVRGLPESEYELSLRDMVEDRGLLAEEGKESSDGGEKSKTKGKRSERKESTAATGGLLLGMRLPFSVGDRRKRLSASRENKSGLGGIGSSSTSSNSSTGSTSSSTTTSNGRSRNKRTNNCYCFFQKNAAGDMD